MHSEATTVHASISMCSTSQDNEMTHEICMARNLAKAAAERIRHLFHLKKGVDGYYSFTATFHGG